MSFSPTSVLGVWLRGLLSVAIIAGTLYCVRQWYDALPDEEQRVLVADDGHKSLIARRLDGPAERIGAWRPGTDERTAWLAGAALLSLWAMAGRAVSVRSRRRRGDDEPDELRSTEIYRVPRPDGADLYVEAHGPADGHPLILIHGWGTDSTIWYYAKRALAGRFRLLVWDLRGIARSTEPRNGDYRLETMAEDLRAVLALARPRPAVVVGHSIGGMIIMTFCRLFPDTLNREVAGIVLLQTTHTNPVRTTSGAPLWALLQKPVLEPLLHLTIWLAPLVRVMNWLSYWNGSAHSSSERSSFAGTETRGQLDFAARYQVTLSPAVLARGQLAMLRYQASPLVQPLPALVTVGDRDPVTKPEAGEHLARMVNAPVAVLSPAKHLGLLERHREVNAEIAGFCATVAAAEGSAGAIPVEMRKSAF